MKKDYCCDLQTCIMCTGCVANWLPAIAANRQNHRFKKGALIFEEGAPVKGIYFLYQGKVKVHKRWGSGKQLILHFAGRGDMVGHRGLGNEKVYPVSATALEDVVACFVDIPFFEATLQVNHQLTYTLMKFYANELQDAERRMRDLAHMDVKGRIAATLLMLKQKFGVAADGHINIALTKQDMASYAGTTYETFFRMLNELIKEKIVKVAGKNITILKENKLLALIKD